MSAIFEQQIMYEKHDSDKLRSDNVSGLVMMERHHYRNLCFIFNDHVVSMYFDILISK